MIYLYAYLIISFLYALYMIGMQPASFDERDKILLVVSLMLFALIFCMVVWPYHLYISIKYTRNIKKYRGVKE